MLFISQIHKNSSISDNKVYIHYVVYSIYSTEAVISECFL